MLKDLMALLVVVALIHLPVTARANGPCEGWASGLHYPGGEGINDLVHAITEWDPDGAGPLPASIVVGGTFGTAGSVQASRVARWDGQSWQSIGAGLNGPVYALAVYNNELYAGGAFSGSGATSALYIARWNGNAWQPVGTGFNGHVRAMTVHAGQLVVGGNFTQSVGGLPYGYVARWNGSTWLPLSTGLGANVKALVSSGGSLFAGGFFGVASWNGSSWQQAGDVDGFSVSALVEHGNELFAGGSFSLPGTPSRRDIVRLSGSMWVPVGGGLTGGEVLALASFGPELVAGGSFTASGGTPLSRIARFDGAQWRPLGTGMDGGAPPVVAALYSRPTELIAGGAFTIAGGDFSFNWARWTGDGTTPHVVEQPEPTTVPHLGDASFGVVALSNPGVPTYQWLRNGDPVANGAGGASIGGGFVTGAQTATVTILGVTYGDAGQYRCVVTNECGATESSEAELSVPCNADTTGDGMVAVDDIFAFLATWFAGVYPDADFNGDQSVTVADIFAFLAAWFAGCD